MEWTVEDIRSELTFDIILMKENICNSISEEEMFLLDNEIDRKISILLPTYDGSISVANAFGDFIEKTIKNFLKEKDIN